MSTKVVPSQHQSYIVVTEIPGHSLTVNGNGGPTTLKEEIPQDTDTLTVPNAEPDSEVAQTKVFKSAFSKFWWLVPLLGVVLAIAGLSVMRLQGKSEGSQATATQIAPLPVQVTPARSGPIQAWASSEGTVQAARFKHLTFDTEGDVTYIIRRNGRPLRAGDRVRQGEQLARIDDRNLLADVNQAQAGIDEARQQKAVNGADVAQAQTQVAQARAQVDQSRAQQSKASASLKLAQTELGRYQQLFNEGALAANELDTYRNAVQNAQADIRAAQGQVNASLAQVRTAQAQVQSAREQMQAGDSKIATARSQLTQAKVALEGTKLYAPFNGIVAYLNIREGEAFTPQAVSSRLGGDYQGITESVPIIVIDPSSFEVIANVPDASGERVQPGQRILIGSEAQIQSASGNKPMGQPRAQGQVFAVNPAVSPGGRSIQVRSRITEGNAKLQHGQQVSQWIAISSKQNAVVVPLNAIVYRDQQPYVFVVNEAEGKVEQRPVELGINGLTQREITSGVQPGDLLVTEGQNRLVDGAPVKVTGNSGEV
ncbi:MAG: efflux RND transporter periplasmic adaptor subunit [Thermosynechococcaceae cyanobacterium]